MLALNRKCDLKLQKTGRGTDQHTIPLETILSYFQLIQLQVDNTTLEIKTNNNLTY